MNLFDHLYHGCHLYLVWYNCFGVFSGCAVSNLEVTFVKYWWNKIWLLTTLYWGCFVLFFVHDREKFRWLWMFEKVTCELPKMCFTNCSASTLPYLVSRIYLSAQQAPSTKTKHLLDIH